MERKPKTAVTTDISNSVAENEGNLPVERLDMQLDSANSSIQSINSATVFSSTRKQQYERGITKEKEVEEDEDEPIEIRELEDSNEEQDEIQYTPQRTGRRGRPRKQPKPTGPAKSDDDDNNNLSGANQTENVDNKARGKKKRGRKPANYVDTSLDLTDINTGTSKKDDSGTCRACERFREVVTKIPVDVFRHVNTFSYQPTVINETSPYLGYTPVLETYNGFPPTEEEANAKFRSSLLSTWQASPTSSRYVPPLIKPDGFHSTSLVPGPRKRKHRMKTGWEMEWDIVRENFVSPFLLPKPSNKCQKSGAGRSSGEGSGTEAGSGRESSSGTSYQRNTKKKKIREVGRTDNDNIVYGYDIPIEVLVLCEACSITFRRHRLACDSCWYVPHMDERFSKSCPRCFDGVLGTH